jgi:hypothetical protein
LVRGAGQAAFGQGVIGEWVAGTRMKSGADNSASVKSFNESVLFGLNSEKSIE